MLAFVVPSEDCKSDEEFSGKREQREKSFSLGRVPQKSAPLNPFSVSPVPVIPTTIGRKNINPISLGCLSFRANARNPFSCPASASVILNAVKNLHPHVRRPQSLSSQNDPFPVEKHQQRLVKTTALHRFKIDISLDELGMFMMLDPFPLQQSGAAHIYHTLTRFVRGVIRHENERKRNILFRQLSHLRNSPV